jgi:hypothetical protein
MQQSCEFKGMSHFCCLIALLPVVPFIATRGGVIFKGPKIGVPYHPPNQGPKSGSQITPQIRVPNQGPISPPKIRVPNRGPKSGSHITPQTYMFTCFFRGGGGQPPNQGPKWRSHITPQIRVPNRGPKLVVPNRGPKSGSQIGFPNGGVPNQGPK